MHSSSDDIQVTVNSRVCSAHFCGGSRNPVELVSSVQKKEALLHASAIIMILMVYEYLIYSIPTGVPASLHASPSGVAPRKPLLDTNKPHSRTLSCCFSKMCLEYCCLALGSLYFPHRMAADDRTLRVGQSNCFTCPSYTRHLATFPKT